MSDRTVILECINKMKRKEETMTNWEKHAIEISNKYQNLNTESFRCERDKMFLALRTIVEKYTELKNPSLFQAIDWLTQEATVCKYCKDNICELRTIDRECFGTEDEMECCGMLTQQEIKSEESNPCDKCAGMDWGDCAICDFKDNLRKKDESDHIGEVNEMVEPQQSKAKFIANGDDYINIQHISNISEVEDKTYIFVDGNEHAFIVDKPVNEVIQQLGIEVV